MGKITREMINKVDKELFKAIEAYDKEDDTAKRKVLQAKAKDLQKKYNKIMDDYYKQDL